MERPIQGLLIEERETLVDRLRGLFGRRKGRTDGRGVDEAEVRDREDAA